MATTSERNSLAFSSWPSERMVRALSGPHSTPVGRLTLPEPIAPAAWSMPTPREASACGSSCTRTAYFWEPKTFTCATPATVEMCCARKVSAYSSSRESGSWSEVSARYRMGESAGFDFW